MKIGVPTEVKNNENRVAITPAGVQALVDQGHEVVIQSEAGLGSAITDDDYTSAGAQISTSADDVWTTADLVLKVKEPVAEEYERMHEGLMLFTYLHLAANEALTRELLERKVTALAYETVRSPNGTLPLLAPMSEIAGRLAPQVGAHTLMRSEGGRGVLLAGVPGVAPAKVVVLGGGVSGLNAARIAKGMGASVTIFDINVERLRHIDEVFHGEINTVVSSSHAIDEALVEADLVIGAVLIPGAKAPTLVTNSVVSQMKPGSVLVDIAIDQGGCFENSHATTHAEPTFTVHNSVFYCVANMPGAVPHTSTRALANVTLPYASAIAQRGWRKACQDDAGLASGLTTHAGRLTNAAVGAATGIESVKVDEVLTD